jgi:hypothetical protein
MPINPLDTLLAIKVLGLVEGLGANDRRVAAILIEHFNRKTGRCDPGIARISELLGISERTVIRANQRLEASGLFRKVRHGGYGNRNSYQPVWSRFAEYQASWQAKMQYRSKSRMTASSSAMRQGCHIQHDNAVTQTYSTNPSQLTCSSGLPKKQVNESNARPIASLSSKGSSAAARDEAERRWNRELDERFRSKPVTYAEIIEAITPAIQNAATDAELKRRGAGIACIIKELKLG